VPSDKESGGNEEGMRQGHWLGSVLCVLFSSLTLLVCNRKDLACATYPFLNSSVLEVVEEDY